MNQKYPTHDTPEAMEGTAAHWGFEEILRGQDIAEGLIAPNGIALTDEMVEAAYLFVEDIDNALRAAHLDRSHLQVERRTIIPAVSEHNWGTPDVWFWDHAMRRLHLFDYKYGHRHIEVFENWQLVDYSLGVLDSLFPDGYDDQTITIEFKICQPRSYHREGPVRAWKTRASDLREQTNKLAAAALRALTNPQQIPNDECEFCPGRHACEALQASAYRAADKAYAVTPLELSPAAAGLELLMLRRAMMRLKARVSGLEEQAEQTIRGGVLVPHWRLAQTSGGRETFKSEAVEAVKAIGLCYGKDLSKTVLLTPKQAVDKGVPREVLAAFINPASSGVKLAEDDGSAARKAFSPGI